MKILDKEVVSNLARELEHSAEKDGVTKHVGAAVPLFEDGILLLKRTAREVFLPDYWELPSGGREPEDKSIINIVARELYEETGLILGGIIKYLGYFDYKTTSNSKVRQWNFLVAVEGEGVLLCPQEHDDYRIITGHEQLSGNLLISTESLHVVGTALNSLPLYRKM